MTTQISAESISLTVYQNTPVITTELLAQLYGTEANNIKVNFTRNADRFVCGKHYFKLESAELRDFKNKVTQSNLVANRAKHLILWSERGAARHAKMLETDQAWEVFEKLEDCYFSKKANPMPAFAGPVNLDILLMVRDDKVALIRQYKAGELITVDEALSLLRKQDWLVMPREELADKLMRL